MSPRAAYRRISATGTGVLLAEQNIGAALDVADRAVVLALGRVVAQGAARSLRGAADLSRLVMGL